MKRRHFSLLFLSAAAWPASTLMAAEVPQPANGQGMVVVYRPSRAKGGALLFPTSINGTSLGNLTNGRIVAQPVAPGQYTIETSSASVAGRIAVTTDVKAGETVFVKAEALIGYPAWRPNLVLVNSAQGAADVSKM